VAKAVGTLTASSDAGGVNDVGCVAMTVSFGPKDLHDPLPVNHQRQAKKRRKEKDDCQR
jgi:hypothetical protein